MLKVSTCVYLYWSFLPDWSLRHSCSILSSLG